jgi:succinate-semialdehyde dehydrogenase/glutarate-semialdehyde dehydrogenase
LTEAVGRLKVGRGTDPGVVQGPLINAAAVDKVEHHIADAVARGAKVAVGGHRHSLGGTFFEPTVLTGVTQEMLITREETFGPVAPLYRFHSEEEAIRLANDTQYGLGGSVHTADVRRAFRVAKAVRAGSFGVNGYTVMPNVPFGGYKASGLGREGGHEGIDAFLETKTIMVNLNDAPY